MGSGGFEADYGFAEGIVKIINQKTIACRSL
jgi:hypothetical protein